MHLERMNPWLREHGCARRALVCFSNVKSRRRRKAGYRRALQIHEHALGHGTGEA